MRLLSEMIRLNATASGARKIKPTRRSVSGLYAFRSDTPIAYESTLERDFIVRQEFCRAVSSVLAQPVCIDWIDQDGCRQKYTPDFLVQFHPASVSNAGSQRPAMLVEVKPRSEWTAHWRKWLPKWRAAWRYARDTGAVFHIQDETRIRDLAFKNIDFLKRYLRMRFPAAALNGTIDVVRQLGPTTVSALGASRFLDSDRFDHASLVWHLVALRKLDCEIEKPLGPATLVWSPAND